jgi:hypothetical protein
MLGRQTEVDPLSPPSFACASVRHEGPTRYGRSEPEVDVELDAGAHLPRRCYRHHCHAITVVEPIDGSISLHRHPGSLCMHSGKPEEKLPGSNKYNYIIIS